MRSLLITGGAGFIGSNFVRYWQRRFPGDRMVVLDALTYAASPDTAREFAADSGITFIHGDIRDSKLVAQLLAGHEIDTIVNFAAESHVDRSIDGPAAFVDSNIVGTHVLLLAARQAWGSGTTGPGGRERRFHQVSTDEVYGSLGASDAPFTEHSPYRPNSPYAASKAAADHLVRAYHKTFGLNVTISNCSNNFGPCQFPEKLIPLMLVNALRGKPLPVYGDGQNVRDWLYVEEHCLGIELVLDRGRSGETYNIGASCEQKNIELVRLLCAEVDAAFQRDPRLAREFPQAPAAHGEATDRLISFVTDRPGHDRRYALDTRRIREELGFRSSPDFRSQLTDTINWYLSHRFWWEPLLSR
jgi:dTDP-glucose 4,6-dehydratase